MCEKINLTKKLLSSLCNFNCVVFITRYTVGFNFYLENKAGRKKRREFEKLYWECLYSVCEIEKYIDLSEHNSGASNCRRFTKN